MVQQSNWHAREQTHEVNHAPNQKHVEIVWGYYVRYVGPGCLKQTALVQTTLQLFTVRIAERRLLKLDPEGCVEVPILAVPEAGKHDLFQHKGQGRKGSRDGSKKRPELGTALAPVSPSDEYARNCSKYDNHHRHNLKAVVPDLQQQHGKDHCERSRCLVHEGHHESRQVGLCCQASYIVCNVTGSCKCQVLPSTILGEGPRANKNISKLGLGHLATNCENSQEQQVHSELHQGIRHYTHKVGVTKNHGFDPRGEVVRSPKYGYTGDQHCHK